VAKGSSIQLALAVTRVKVNSIVSVGKTALYKGL